MSADDGCIDQKRLVILVLGEFRQDPSPHTSSCPTREARVNGLPLGVVLGQIAPGGAGLENPPDRVDDLPVVEARAPFTPPLRWQKVANSLPLLRLKLVPSGHL